jgi:hypothetical protein
VDANAHSNGHAFADGHLHTNAYANCNRHTNTDAYEHGHTGIQVPRLGRR